MHKKSAYSELDSAIASVAATANAQAEDNEPQLTETEARTLFLRKFKKAARKLVADTVDCEPEDVVWVTVEPKSRKKATTEAAA